MMWNRVYYVLRFVVFWVRATREEKEGALPYFWQLERQRDRVRAARLAAERSTERPSLMPRMPPDVFERLRARECASLREGGRLLTFGSVGGENFFSSRLLVKLPKGANRIIFTVSWVGSGGVEILAESPSETYTEDTLAVCVNQIGRSASIEGAMLNVKRVSLPILPLTKDEDWRVILEFHEVEDCSIIVEVQETVERNLVHTMSTLIQTKHRVICHSSFSEETRFV
jgi:hypothetical protein